MTWMVARFIMLLAPLGAAETEVWRVERADRVGGHAAEVWGAPRAERGALVFDGKGDGLLVEASPLAGVREFTIEILFSPSEGGAAEQRFFHLEDAGKARAMIETRLDGKGGWWLDTYLFSGGQGRPLIDPKRVHPTGRWCWAALRYDGKTMTSFVDGKQELAGAVDFAPWAAAAKLSLGVRQNRVHWFKGAIREVRFTRAALAAEKLQRP